MKTLKQSLDHELLNIEMPASVKENTLNKITATSKHRYKPIEVAAMIILCLALGSSAVYAVSSHFFAGGYVNQEEMPALDEYKVININDNITNTSSISADTELIFYDYKEFMDDLGVKLLNSPMTQENDQMMILYENIGEAVYVKINGFLVGDATITGKSEDGNSYTFEPGNIYGSPITLKISFATTPAQAESGLDVEYLGYYKFDYNYISNQGWKVNVITSSQELTEEQRKMFPLYQPTVISVFVADGIRYELRGAISKELMEEIVNSMGY